MQHLYSQLGRAYELLSEVEQARPVYQEMLAFAQASDVPEMECIALNRLAILMIHHTYDLEQALSLLQQALRVAEKSHDTMGLAETEWSRALLNIYRFDIPSAIALGKRALELARQLEQPALIARCLNVLCFATHGAGLWEESATYAQEALSLHRQRVDRAMEVEILCNLSSVELGVGRLQSAGEMALEAQKIALATENWWGQTNALFHLALVAMEQGEYGKALATAQRCVSMAHNNEVIFWQDKSLVALGMVYRAVLALDKARAAHEKALAFHSEIKSLSLSRTSAAELCADCALAGAWPEAASYALQAMEPQMPVFLLCSRLQRWYEIEALLRAGEVEQAVEYVQRLGKAIGTSKRHRISYLRSLAVLDQYRGEVDRAIAYLQEAAQLAEEIGLPGELWLIQAALAELYRQQGNDEESSTAFRQAASILYRLADSLEDADHRTTFLASPQVRRILERKE